MQLTQNSGISDIAALQGYEVVNKNNQDRFQSITVCKAVDTYIISHTKLSAAFLITV